MKELNFNHLAYEWTPVKNKDFTIQVRGWKFGESERDTWKWNVYAFIFDTHPMFGKFEWAECLPMHGGVTYDKVITTEPAVKKYDHQATHKVMKYGCDYQHYGDEYFESCDPKDGIPCDIRRDVRELYEHLLECAKVD